MKKLFTSLITLLLSLNLFSQEILNVKSSSWQTVIPGSLLCEPQKTSYGFSFITDAKTLLTYSNNGTLLWEKNIKKCSKPMLSVFYGDFFGLVSNSGKKFAFLNPNGNELWSKVLENPANDKPYQGRDGRIILRNTNSIWCYGINGIQKWTINTPEQSMAPIQELPDGSLIVFLTELVDNKTKGLRVSPFGEVMEEIIFSGKVISSTSCNEGVLLTFENGMNGLCSLQDNKAVHKWTLQNNGQYSLDDIFITSYDKTQIVYISKKDGISEVNYINPKNGEFIKSYKIKSINKIKCSNLNKTGLFITDAQNAYYYNNNGQLLWDGQFPQNSKNSTISNFIYTQDNYLILFNSNWIVNAFRTTQNIKSITENITPKNYFSFYKINTKQFGEYYMPDEIDRDFVSAQRVTELQKGEYGTKEVEWAGLLVSACMAKEESYFTASTGLGNRGEKSIFETDKIGVEAMMQQLSLFETSTFTDYIAEFINKENESAYLKKLLQGIKSNGYDPDKKILESLYKLCRRTSEKDEVLLMQICDAVYSICYFMGKPAYNAYGKEILTSLLYPKYNDKVRAYARQTFKKISDLEL